MHRYILDAPVDGIPQSTDGCVDVLDYVGLA